MKLNMGQKIGISLSFLTLILGLIGCYVYVSSAHIAANVSDMRLAQDQAFLASQIELDYTGAVLEMRRYIGDGDESYRQNAMRAFRKVMNDEYRLLVLSDSESKGKINDLIKQTRTYIIGVTDKYVPLLQQERKERAAGNFAKADELATRQRQALYVYTSQARSIQVNLRIIANQNQAIITAKLRSVVQDTESVVPVVFFAFLVALIAAIGLSYRLTKTVTGPLQNMKQSMDEMAAGNFEQEVSLRLIGRSDEFGLMATSLATMKTNTRDMIGKIHSNREQMQALLTANPDLIMRLSSEGKYLEVIEPSGWSPFNMYGIELGGHISRNLSPRLTEQFMTVIQQTLLTGQNQSFEYETEGGGGQWTRECRTVKMTESEVMFIVRDITHRRKVEETLRQIVEGMSNFIGQDLFDYLTEYFAKTFNVRYCFIGEFVEPGRINLLSGMARGVKLNPLCFEVGEGQPSYDIYQGKDVLYNEKVWQDYPAFCNIYRVAAAKSGQTFLSDSKDERMESYIGVPLKNSAGQVLGVMALMDERPVPNVDHIISIFRIFAVRVAAELDRIFNERKIEYMAYHDALTGLPNRWKSQRWLDEAISQTEVNPGLIAILRFDIDNFRYVNDTIGRAAGDKLFIAAAERFRQGVCGKHSNCNLARLDGDNFVIVAFDAKAEDAAFHIGQALANSLKHPFQCEERDIYLNTSIGISMYPRDGKTSEELLSGAERALIYAKEHAKGSIQMFDPSLQAEAMKKMTLLNDLRNAITNEEFLLYYQPQYDATAKTMLGMEALIRWRHPRRGLVAPMEFIPLAEASGLIITIGEWVINEACRQVKKWQDEGALVVPVAVNISAVQFNQSNFVDVVSRAIAAHGINADLLELEITENITMNGVEKVKEKLAELSALGVAISIDDFGTGYSSLSYLQTFPLSNLKIDRSFVRNVHVNRANADIVSAIIALAHNLNLRVVAEGVETDEELEFLREKDCDVIQGYCLSYPLPAEELFTR